ncbi:DUF523 and DUF1722 domain-containing protein [Bacillus shivajii]|uniref:YbgA family protein n=1 Tax=Bacillus shivajii TaxID=1983719 RepID=UPI001CF9F499|nr:DUF523 and DUF1722 domain-containing protein [Bacillus shivajii]UCZ55239.1 DUF523 and DUF1722 domain-containing protein [Bacillus shivajii]
MKSFEKPTVVVSKCLGFDACRYNGDALHDRSVDKLAPFVQFIPVCPEEEIGLGTPRDPIRIVAKNKENRLMQPATKKDLTEEMTTFSQEYLHSLEEIDGFILKTRSPSCAISDAKVMSGLDKSPTIDKSAGLFGKEVLKKFSHLAIEDEGRLKNFTIREHFFTKIFILATFRKIKKSLSYQDLLQFHSHNKYLFMAFHQLKLKELGRITANHNKEPIEHTLHNYEKVLYELLSHPPTCAKNINVLHHIMGYFSKKLTHEEKSYFLNLIEQYRENKVPLSSPVGVLRAWVSRFQHPYLQTQTFFTPYPEELVEITDSGKGRSYT